MVEFALVLPVFLLLLLGFAELAFLFAGRQGYQNGVEVLAAWAASEMAERPEGESWREGWQRVVAEEAERVGCEDPSGPELELPDGTHGPGDRVLVRWACAYSPQLLRDWTTLTVRVESEAVVPGAPPAPSPAPSPS